MTLLRDLEEIFHFFVLLIVDNDRPHKEIDSCTALGQDLCSDEHCIYCQAVKGYFSG